MNDTQLSPDSGLELPDLKNTSLPENIIHLLQDFPAFNNTTLPENMTHLLQNFPAFTNTSLPSTYSKWTSQLLSSLPPGFTGTETENKLRFLELMFSLAPHTTAQSVSALWSAFLRAVELGQCGWSSWDHIQAWLSNNCQFLHLAVLPPPPPAFRNEFLQPSAPPPPPPPLTVSSSCGSGDGMVEDGRRG